MPGLKKRLPFQRNSVLIIQIGKDDAYVEDDCGAAGVWEEIE